jgi:hypothetical protein
MEVMSVRGMSAAVGLAMALAVGAWGQAPQQEKKPDAAPPCLNATAQNCAPAKAAPAKSAAEENPFPGESSAPPTRPADWGPDQPLPPDPNAPTAAPAPAPKPGETQPFPGEPAPPPQAQKPGEPAPPSDDAFSSSSSSSSSADVPPDDDAGLADKGSSGDTTANVPIRRRKKLPKVTPETPESRASEDLTVADFYQNDGNFKGAYDRAKDAVQYQPNDPYGHFALAEAARKLGKLDEAKTEYQAVLKLDPIPKQEKASKRALAEMEGK